MFRFNRTKAPVKSADEKSVFIPIEQSRPARNISSVEKNLFAFAKNHQKNEFLALAEKEDILFYLSIGMDAELHSLSYWLQRWNDSEVNDFIFKKYNDHYFKTQTWPRDENKYFEYLLAAIIYRQSKKRIAEILAILPKVFNGVNVHPALLEEVYFSAIINGYEAVVEKLAIDQNSFLSDCQVAPLMLAAATHQPAMTKLILADMVVMNSVNRWHYSFVVKKRDDAMPAIIKVGDGLMNIIVKSNDIESLRLIIAKFSKNVIDLNEAMILAVKDNRKDMVKLLLAEGVNPNFIPLSGQSAYNVAIEHGFKEIAEIFKWAEIEKDYSAAFVKAYLGADHVLAKEIYRKGKLVNQVQDSDNGMTLLMYAAKNCEIGLVKILVECGEELNKVSKEGATALDYALIYGWNTVASYLKQHGAISNLNTQKIIQKREAIKRLDGYIKEVDKREDSHYLRSYKFCIFTVNLGYSAQLKKAASHALKEVIEGRAHKSTLFAHKKVLDNGRLKTIYRALM